MVRWGRQDRRVRKVSQELPEHRALLVRPVQQDPQGRPAFRDPPVQQALLG